MYEYIDEHISDKKEKAKRKFNRLRLDLMKKSDISVDEVKEKNDKTFDELHADDVAFLTALILWLNDGDKTDYSVDKFLESYNKTTLYVYNNEVERKKNRYFESLIGIMAVGSVLESSNLSNADALRNQKTNVNNWNNQTEEFAVDMERDFTLFGYRKDGVEYVEWVTVADGHVCDTCDELNGQVFAIDELPPRPHRHCRCEFKPVEKSEID